ncbi:MAG: SWIM zinc finger domain-containing protein [Lachnospira sp.]|nr:SWIM zinc finger domain-containing protein [Lachnospira sp.]MDD5829377.1 SWIM zinc finger domain-containing protein [Lachnospira sp.]
MGLIELASNNSVWRGMDYYENKKVLSWNKVENGIYEGIVSGQEDRNYSVHIDKIHPRKSTCNCPFADGRRVICKHMIALYFTAEPNVAQDFLRQVEKWEQEEEQREQEYYQELRKYVNSLSKVELQERLYDALVELEDRRNNYW